MAREATLERCSDCGVRAPREEMFGAPPDLLCERCAAALRARLAPRATGRLVSGALLHRPAVTIAALVAAGLLFVASRGWGSPAAWPSWAKALGMYGGGGWVVDGEAWRLLTAAFLHIGIFHLVFNAFWIWNLGQGVEGRWNSWSMAFLLVGSAVASSALQWWFSGPGVGLSGVVYALAAFLFVHRKVDPVARAIMNPSTTRLLIAWLVIGVVLTELDLFPIGNWAHGGGAAWGALAGLAWLGRPRWPWILLLLAGTVALGALVSTTVPPWAAPSG